MNSYMSTNKEIIKQKFNRCYKTYDKYCSVQNKICEHTIQLLTKHISHANHIADMGCGTGESTQQLINTFSSAQYYCVDIAENLLNIAKSKLSGNIHFLVSDFDLSTYRDDCFDLIFSNMAFQWSSNLLQNLKIFYSYLVKDGVIIFSMPINNSFPELKSHCKLKNLPHANIVDMLHESRFELIEHMHYVMTESFSSQTNAIRSLKNVGANFNNSPTSQPTHSLSKNSIKNAFVNQNVSQLTYTIGIYLAIKK